MRRSGLPWLHLALPVCLLVLTTFPAGGQGYDVRMQKVLAQFVETTGLSIMGVGSWISGKGFDPKSSDFDMRLVIKEGGTEAQHLARWQQAQNQMRDLIRKEFGSEAGNILGRTNLYAPNQLMQGVENAEDALERFQRLKRVPNLGHTGAVTSSTPAKYAEGLYGSGSQTYVQGYERAAGRLFYSNNGKCVTGLSELAHMGEGVAKYTAAGTASTAGQWAQHALDELRAGRGDKVAKFLERMERDLVKSCSMSRLPMDEAYRSQLRSMQQLLKNSPGKLADVADDVALMLARGSTEAALLGSYANAGPLRRAYVRVMLDGVRLKNQVGKVLGKVMGKLPNWANAENTINFLLVCIGTKAASESLGRGDNAFETMSNVCGALNPFKMIGPTLLAEVMAEVIAQARANGFEMAAGFQGAWDLLEGVYSAWGRCDVDPDPRRKLTLADLVTNFQYERQVEAIVMAQAIRASTRGLGTANAQHDEGVANAIFAKCWPVIRDAWLWERDMLASEYLRLGSEVVHTPLIIYYKPTAPKPGESIVCEAVSADQKLGERLERMKQIFRILYGKGSVIAVNYYWTPAGVAVGDRDWQRGFKFDKPGKYPVKVRLEINPITSHTQTEPRVMLQRTVEALVEVEVGGGDQPGIPPWLQNANPGDYALLKPDLPAGFSIFGDIQANAEARGFKFTDAQGKTVEQQDFILSILEQIQVQSPDPDQKGCGVVMCVWVCSTPERAIALARQHYGNYGMDPDWMVKGTDLGAPAVPPKGGSVKGLGKAIVRYRNLVALFSWNGRLDEFADQKTWQIARVWLKKVERLESRPASGQ